MFIYRVTFVTAKHNKRICTRERREWEGTSD